MSLTSNCDRRKGLKKPSKSTEQMVIYQTKNKDIFLDVKIDKDTVWLTQAQMTKLFGRDRTVITKHINNVFTEKEINEKSNVQNLHIANSDKPVKEYSLDVVISVGYRVKSIEGTRFRQWATKTLRENILKGYTLNHARLKTNYTEFMKAVDSIKTLIPSTSSIENDSILELITLFADTWLSLDAYDKDCLKAKGMTKKKVKIRAENLNHALSTLKETLIAKREATELFGKERSKDGLASIVGNVMQSFANNDLYPTIEEKAAHLFYFIIKNHPFADGNKRSGAYAFIWFLEQAKVFDKSRMTPQALTALTLLIAESNPKDKEKMIGLVCALLVK